MKNKIFLSLSICLLGFLFANASGDPCKTPGPGNGTGTGKKNDIIGNILHAETRKPLKDVSITAYISSKKEKVIITDINGTYAFDDLRAGTYKFVFEKEGFKKVIKDKVIIKTDEAFQLDIEMIENEEFDLMPSPFHFSNVK